MKTVKVAAIGLVAGLGGLMAAPASAQEYTAVMQRDIKWQDAPSIGPGAKTAVIQGDPKASGPFVMRLKVPPKTTLGVHTHPAAENVTVLAGILYFAAGDKLDRKAARAFGPGSYFSIEQGKPMFAFTTDKEATLQLHGNGPWGITYVEKK
jgi:quercetin dioxygenase-like cupin family protein